MRNAFIVCILLSCFLTENISADPGAAVSPQKLDESIRKVIQQREYQWRMPREHSIEKEQNLFLRFWESAVRLTLRWLRPVRDLFLKIRDWIRDRMPSAPFSSDGKGSALKAKLPLLTVLTIVVLVLVGMVYWQIRKRKISGNEIVNAQAVAIPDIRDEKVIADQLPEEGWQQMARDLLDRGELRLAMRALFMASLSFLAGSELIRIAHSKSNREYQKELQRRAHERHEVLDAFSQNVAVLERTWYGKDPATRELVTQFADNLRRIKEAGA